jgi:hypothetical protein
MDTRDDWHYAEEEFQITHYFLGPENGSAVIIQHPASGMRSEPFYLTADAPAGARVHRWREEAMADLVRRLTAAGIAPEPPRIGTKKVGRQRWTEEQKHERDRICSEVTHE